jgi:hypothetical protein
VIATVRDPVVVVEVVAAAVCLVHDPARALQDSLVSDKSSISALGRRRGVGAHGDDRSSCWLGGLGFVVDSRCAASGVKQPLLLVQLRKTRRDPSRDWGMGTTLTVARHNASQLSPRGVAAPRDMRW